MHLNGECRGILHTFLADHEGEPRIAWYPSAGSDFRALMYLHPAYTALAPSIGPEPLPPDIFVFTDLNDAVLDAMYESSVIYEDEYTTVKVEKIEELPTLSMTIQAEDPDIRGRKRSGRVICMMVSAVSTILGEIRYPVIYAITANEVFFSDIMHPKNVRLSHIVHIRYGGGLGGGGFAAGTWMRHILRQVGCDVYISDGHTAWQIGDESMVSNCPAVPPESDVHLHPIRMIPGVRWSNHGDVTWNLVVTKAAFADFQSAPVFRSNPDLLLDEREADIPVSIGNADPGLIVVCSITSLLLEMATARVESSRLTTLPESYPETAWIRIACRTCTERVHHSEHQHNDLRDFWSRYCGVHEQATPAIDYFMDYTTAKRFPPFIVDTRLNKVERFVKWSNRLSFDVGSFRRWALGNGHANDNRGQQRTTFLDHDAFLEIFAAYVAGSSIEGKRLSPWFKEFEQAIRFTDASGEALGTSKNVQILFLEDLTTLEFTAMEKFRRRYSRAESQDLRSSSNISDTKVQIYYGLPPGVPLR